MIKHIVCWKIKPELNKSETIARIKSELESLPALIREIKMLEVGVNVTHIEVAYDVVLVSDFESLEALDIYQKHPAHQRAAQYIRSVVSERVLVDYEF